MYVFVSWKTYMFIENAKQNINLYLWIEVFTFFTSCHSLYLFKMVSDICIFSLVDKSWFHRSAYCPSFFILLYFSSGILFTFSVYDTLCSWYISTEQEMSISHRGFFLHLQNCYFIIKYNGALQRLPFLGNYSKSYHNTIIVHFQRVICILSFLKVDPLFLTIK